MVSVLGAQLGGLPIPPLRGHPDVGRGYEHDVDVRGRAALLRGARILPRHLFELDPLLAVPARKLRATTM